MSDTSRVQLASVVESVYGVTPASAMTNKRMVSESLKYNIGTDVSAEIREDRQTSDLIQTSFDAGGDVNFEFSFGSYDDWLESALYSTFSTPITVSLTDISAAAADNSLNTVAGDFTTENISVGQWIKIGGFTGEVANNGYAKVVSVVALKIIVSGITLVDDAAGETVTLKGSMIRNGTTQKSFTLEKNFSDITQYLGLTGMVANTFNLNIESQQKTTGSFGFIGKQGVLQQTAFGTGANGAASTSKIFSVGSHIKNIRENAAALGDAYAKTLNLSLTNNIRPQDAVGHIGAVGVSAGTVGVTGQLTAYFENELLYDKFTNKTDTSLDYRLEDAAGNAYIISLPKVNYSDGEIVTPGINEFLVVNLPFTCILDSVQKTIQIDKIPA